MRRSLVGEQGVLFGGAGATAPVVTSDAWFTGLRPYQHADVEYAWSQLKRVRGTLICQATGLGKTKTACAFIRRWVEEGRGRVLWLVTGDELVGQAQDELRATLGEWVSREQADSRASNTRVVVGSVPTMKGARLEAWPAGAFTLIVLDECHHSASKSWRAIVDHFPEAKRLGLSATPKRHDKKALGLVFDDWVKPTRPISWGIDNGYLVPFVSRYVNVDAVDLRNVGSSAGDLNLDELEKEVCKGVAPIGRKTFEIVEDRRTLIYTPGVGSAHGVAKQLNILRPGCARSLDGKTPRDARRILLEEHKRDVFQFLVNCAVLKEGYNDPGLRAVVIARPTKSRPMYIQMAGRLGRPVIPELAELSDRLSAIAASAKPDGMLIDITGHAGRHLLVSAVDLDGRYTEKERVRAKELLEQEPGKRLDDALSEAAKQLRLEEEARKEQMARVAAEAEVRARTGVFDPFSAYGLKDPVAQGIAPSWSADPPSPKQVAWLRQNRLPVDSSRAQAKKLYAAAMVRQKRGLCDFATLGALRKWGVAESVAKNLTRDKARVLLDEVAKRRGAPPPEVLQTIIGSAA